jgi:uncharacterized membrane protein
MQNDGNNNFNNQNGQPGPGGYEYNPNDFQGGQNNYQNYNNGQGGYDPNGFNNGGFGQPPQNRIILESCYNLRRMAREALRGKWLMATVAAYIIVLLLSIPNGIIDGLFGISMPLTDYMSSLGYTDLGPEFDAVMIKASPLSGIYSLLVTGPLTFGMTAYFLILFRRGKETLGDLFSGFEFFGKTLGLFLWMCLWVFLWALIPIAGPVLAIIAGFRYAMAFMIQVDNPSLPIRDCLNRSKFMMKGNKGKLFLLTLSFIGWLILAAIPGAILGAIFGMFTSNIVVLQIVSYIASFATSVVVAYITTAQMAFYDMLTGRIYGESYVPGRY